MGTVVVVVAYLTISHRYLIKTSAIWRILRHQSRTQPGIFAIVSAFNVVLFAWATRYVDPVIAAIVSAAWLIIFVVVRKWHDTTSQLKNRYGPVPAQDYILMTTAFVGVGLVTLSESGNIQYNDSGLDVLVGISLATLAAVLAGAGTAYKFRVGEVLYTQSTKVDTINQRAPKESQATELACLMLVDTFADLIAGSVSLSIALIQTRVYESNVLAHVFSPTEFIIIIVGGIPVAAGAILLRKANLITYNLGINTMSYFTPVLSLGWLFLFSTVSIERHDLLIAGAAVVCAASILVSFRDSYTQLPHNWDSYGAPPNTQITLTAATHPQPRP